MVGEERVMEEIRAALAKKCSLHSVAIAKTSWCIDYAIYIDEKNGIAKYYNTCFPTRVEALLAFNNILRESKLIHARLYIQSTIDVMECTRRGGGKS